MPHYVMDFTKEVSLLGAYHLHLEDTQNSTWITWSPHLSTQTDVWSKLRTPTSQRHFKNMLTQRKDTGRALDHSKNSPEGQDRAVAGKPELHNPVALEPK